MPLTDEQRQVLRDEEFFRDQVRKELTAPRAPPGLLQRWSAFFDSKVGFWLLTTVLAGVSTAGYSTLKAYLDREEIAVRESAERARRDLDVFLKLAPLLHSDKPGDVGMASLLLNGLATGKAVDSVVAAQVVALFVKTASEGNLAGAGEQARARANAVLPYIDQERLTANQANGPVGSTAVASSLDKATVPSIMAAPSPLADASLPVRVYLQIGAEANRPAANRIATALRQSGLIAPGIELVPARKAPAQTDLRYCGGKVDEDALQRVKSAAAAIVNPAPQARPIPEALCGNVRHNHFEIWMARSTG